MSIVVLLPGVLREHAEGNDEVTLDDAGAVVIDDVLAQLAARWPTLGQRLRDDTGRVRRHVNLFVDGQDVRHLQGARTPVPGGSVVQVLPSVAGG